MITSKEYEKRRRDLMNQIGTNAVAIVPSASEKVRSRDTNYQFRQDSQFSYLTGFPEPDALVALLPGRAQGEYVIFCRDKDRSREIWDGFRFGPEGACSEFGADDAFPMDDIDEILPGMIEGRERVFFTMGTHKEFDQKLLQWLQHIRSHAKA